MPRLIEGAINDSKLGQSQFNKISKHLIDKPSPFAHKEISLCLFCFSDDQQLGASVARTRNFC